MARLLDLPDEKGRYPFSYRPAAQTDLHARFAAERKRIKAEQDAVAQEREEKVRQIKRGKA